MDHRLVRDDYLTLCDRTSLALYLFLVTVCDVQGLSYYSDASICRRLKIDALDLATARMVPDLIDTSRGSAVARFAFET